MGQTIYAAHNSSGSKIYAVSGVCDNIHGQPGKVMTTSTIASSSDEAIGWGYAQMHRLYPILDGYRDYLVYVVEVPPAFINRVYPLVGWEDRQ